MKNFDADLTTALAAEIARLFDLVEFDFSSALRYSTLDFDIYYGGEKYEPLGLEVSNITMTHDMEVDRVTLDLDNVGMAFSAVLLGEDVRNKPVTISRGALNANLGIIAVEPIFTGKLTSWEIVGDRRAQVSVANEMSLWSKHALRIHQATCPWLFMDGVECAYSGSGTWCDQSYDRCASLANTINFGGFRFLPAVSEKEIWWGRLPG